MRKAIIAALAAAVVATGLLGTAGAFASTPRARSTTLQFTAHATQATIVDVTAAGPSPGDQQVVVGTLTHNGTTVGRFGFVCEQLSAGPNAAEECSATGRIAHGNITLEGYSKQSSSDHVWAIVGGTGNFQHATGQVLIHDVNDTTSTLKLELG
jgi:hypothetical protein